MGGHLRFSQGSEAAARIRKNQRFRFPHGSGCEGESGAGRRSGIGCPLHGRLEDIAEVMNITAKMLSEQRSELDRKYLEQVLRDGRASEIMDMVREMDNVCSVLGIQESFTTPTDAIKKLMSASQ